MQQIGVQQAAQVAERRPHGLLGGHAEQEVGIGSKGVAFAVGGADPVLGEPVGGDVVAGDAARGARLEGNAREEVEVAVAAAEVAAPHLEERPRIDTERVFGAAVFGFPRAPANLDAAAAANRGLRQLLDRNRHADRRLAREPRLRHDANAAEAEVAQPALTLEPLVVAVGLAALQRNLLENRLARDAVVADDGDLADQQLRSLRVSSRSPSPRSAVSLKVTST